MRDAAGVGAGAGVAPVVGAGEVSPVVGTAVVAGWLGELGWLDRDVDDAERVEQLRVLEELKAAAAAAQARVAAALDASQRAAQAAAGVPARDLGKGVASQVGLARRESPVRGAQHLGLGKVLTAEMPHTLAGLSAGWLSEWRATLLVRETAHLSLEHRRIVDAELAGDPDRIATMGDKALVAAARKIGYRLDPHAAVRRAAHAASERRVTCRPTPDTMAYLSALLPVKQAVAAYAALARAAESARAAGDPRGRGQVMADTLVERVTGQATADGVPLAVGLVITDRALFAGGGEPAELPGYGPVPAGLARHWITTSPEATSEEVRITLRRLFTHPGSGELVAMDAKTRAFTGGLREFVRLRDAGVCRTPWCDAPARHTDHLVPHAADGPTSAENAQGLCEACNYAKQAPGWSARHDPAPGRRHTVITTTPTAHSYHSTAPPPPGHPDATPLSHLEVHFTDLLLTA